MTFKPTRMETAVLVVVALQIALAVFVARYGSTQPIPLHFNFSGVADRWGDRHDAAMGLLLLAAINLAVAAALSFSQRVNAPDLGRRRGLVLAQGVALVSIGGISILPAVLASPGFDPALGGQLAASGLCLMLAVIGAVLGKVPPNALVGVRTPWSLTSRRAWDRSNRLAGRLFFWGGLIALPILPALPQAAALQTVTIGALLIAAVVVFESWRVWRTDPDRRTV